MKLLRLSAITFVLAGALSAILAPPAGAQTSVAPAAGFTLEQVLSSPFPTELIAARSGTRIAWVFRAQGRRNIWVAEGPKFAARQLTTYKNDDGREIADLNFSADGSAIIFTRGGDKNSAGEVPNPESDASGVKQEIWVVVWAGGPPRRIDEGDAPATSPKGAWVAYNKGNQLWLASLAPGGKPRQIHARGGSGSPQWSPDGKQIAFVSNRGTHSFIGIYNVAKNSLRWLAPSVDRDSTPRWSPDGKSIAFIRQPARMIAPQESFWTMPDRPQPWAILIGDVAAGTVREIRRSPEKPEGNIPRMAGAWSLQWGGDGRIIFSSEEDGWQRLYSMPASGGDATGLTPTGCEYEHAVFAPDRKHIIVATNCGDIDRRHLQRVSVGGGAVENLTSGEGIEWSPVVTGDAKWIAYLGSDARMPAMPFVRAANAGGASQSEKGTMLAARALPKDFPSAQLVVPQNVTVRAPDGVECHNQLFLPRDIRPGERRPAILFMHGGPMRQMMLGWHNRGYYHQAYAVNQYLASRGYIVLSVNYRSGIMYGRAFREAPNRGARGASEYQDIVAAGKYLAERADVNPEKIGLWGGSYGGYLTAMGLARNSDLFAAGVDLHGVHDWSARGGVDAPMSREQQATARNASPVASVDKWHSPVLLVHGDDDRNVAFSQTTDLAARLRQQKVEFEQMVFPDEVHDFLLFRNWLRIYAATADFFDRHLK